MNVLVKKVSVYSSKGRTDRKTPNKISSVVH